MTYQPRFRFEQRDKTGGVIFDGDDPIAEIRDLRLCNVVLRPLDPSSSLDASSRRKPGSRPSSPHTPSSPRRRGSRIIGPDVPLPLYWQQYANHQHPERNAGSHGRLECVSSSASKISLKIESASHSREVTSRYLLDVSYSEQRGSYVFDFRCRLDVPEGKQWHVSHNPSHGELEFCNLWPEGTFVLAKPEPASPHDPSPQAPSSFPRRRESSDHAKSYQACYVQSGDRTEWIPHHHLETSDKHNIGMGPGDRFLWLLENENPVVEICSSEPVAAGLCAYMWDAHFAYRVCEDGTDAELPSGASYDAHFRLYAVSREEGERVISVATPRESPDLETIPLYVDGLNTFSETLSRQTLDPRLRGDDAGGEARAGTQGVIPEQTPVIPARTPVIPEQPPVIPAQAGIQGASEEEAWPWEHDPEIPDVIEYALDRTEGHSDNASVRIHAFRPATGRWLATTLGSAFGEAPFESGKRYRLSGFVKSRDLIGTARIGLRLHRTGMGDVFDLASYETYYSVDGATVMTDWKAIEVTTPVIDPPPDRMHLLLEMDGTGTCWFDDVLFERNV